MQCKTSVWLALSLLLAAPALFAQAATAPPTPQVHAAAEESEFQNTYWPAELAGQAALKKGATQTAEKNFRTARAAAEACGDTKWSELAGTIAELGSIARDAKNYPEAQQLYKEALALQEQHQPAVEPEVGGALQALANIYMAQDQPNQAEPLLLRSVDIYEKRLATAPTPDIRAAYGRHIAWASFWLVAMATSSNRPDVAQSRCQDGMQYAKYLPADQLDTMTRGCAEVASHGK
jgi:tetratricopeptide (TPR) repeat protein